MADLFRRGLFRKLSDDAFLLPCLAIVRFENPRSARKSVQKFHHCDVWKAKIYIFNVNCQQMRENENIERILLRTRSIQRGISSR